MSEAAPKTDIHAVADRLWETADELRANSHLKAGEYSIPVLGLIFLKFADSRFTQAEAELAGKGTGRRQIGKADYQAKSVLYLPEAARFGAQAALEALRADAVDTDDAAPVFATVERKRGQDGVMRPVGRPLSPRMVSRVFRRYAERAGLPDSIRLHDLRHTAITNAIGQGEDILLVAAFAGHANTSTTVDVYSHLLPKRAHEAAKRMRSVAHNPADPPPADDERAEASDRAAA